MRQSFWRTTATREGASALYPLALAQKKTMSVIIDDGNIIVIDDGDDTVNSDI